MEFFSPADILIPKEHYRERFCVVACDQYTSQPEYWEAVEDRVKDAPSALRLIVPESRLEQEDMAKTLADVHTSMEHYLAGGIFDECRNSYIYVERTLRSGRVRRGVVGKLDLKAYDYGKRSRSPVRATEATVVERIPPRVAVREGACLESPHVMVLIDDEPDSVIGLLSARRGSLEKLYDFPLMMDSGRAAGWRVTDQDAAALDDALQALCSPQKFAAQYGEKYAPIYFAMGDGNHSLATARECYRKLCEKYGEDKMENHPARWALVELVNLHDTALEFEPVHRALFDVDRRHFLGKMETALETTPDDTAQASTQRFVLVRDGQRTAYTIGMTTSNMAVGSLQNFLDDYIAEFGGRCDYIHGDDVVEDLSRRSHTLCFMLPPIQRSELIRTVLMDGALTRKTFSMGNACDKRFYLECRRIKE